jgi:hypothetical protein
MAPLDALRNAEQFIFMAEETKDALSRRRYEALARGWLDQVDVEKWLDGNVSSHPLANEPGVAVLQARTAMARAALATMPNRSPNKEDRPWKPRRG